MSLLTEISGCVCWELLGKVPGQDLETPWRVGTAVNALLHHCCSVAKLCLTLRDLMDCNTSGLPVPHHLKLMSFALVMPSNHLILCRPLLLLPSIFPSIRVFANVSALHIRWPKYWSFSIGPSSEYSGLISFRIACFDLLAVQGTLKSLLQHHSSKPSIFQCSAFFIVQLSHHA